VYSIACGVFETLFSFCFVVLLFLSKIFVLLCHDPLPYICFLKEWRSMKFFLSPIFSAASALPTTSTICSGPFHPLPFRRPCVGRTFATRGGRAFYALTSFAFLWRGRRAVWPCFWTLCSLVLITEKPPRGLPVFDLHFPLPQRWVPPL